jgi:hypothetical protein
MHRLACVALALRLLLLGPPAVEQVVGNAQLSGHLRDRSCCVSDQSNCFRLTFFCVLPSGLGAHTVLQFHHTPPYTGVCEIGGRSNLCKLYDLREIHIERDDRHGDLPTSEDFRMDLADEAIGFASNYPAAASACSASSGNWSRMK